MHTSRRATRFLFFTFALGLSFWAIDDACSQEQQLGTKKAVESAFEKTSKTRNELIAGERPATPADKAIAEAAAQFYVYRITWRPSDDATKYYAKVQTEFAAAVDDMLRKKNNQAFVQMFGVALIESMKQAFAVDRDSGALMQAPPTMVNACMMLPTMGKLRQDKVTDFLASLASDGKRHDVIRLYAIKALKECMPVQMQQPEFADEDFADKKRLSKKNADVKAVDTLAQLIDTPVKISGLSSGQLGVVHYFRREAIVALAEAGTPAVIAYKKPAKLEGAVAPTLLHVLSPNNDMEPPPNMQERIEASIGLCRMKYANVPEYQPEIAVYLVGRTLVDFVFEYSGDYENFAIGKGVAKKLPKLAWRTESKRFETALKDLVENAGNNASARSKAEQLKSQASSLLLNMTKYIQMDRLKVDEFRGVVNSLRPKSGAVFKSLPSRTIPLK